MSLKPAQVMASGRPARCPDNTKLYAVLFFGSHPDLENDDCFYGHDFDTLAEALVEFQKPPRDIMLDGSEGPNGEPLMRRNPSFRRSTDNGEWAREYATQAGMMGGCEGYNDAMGYV